MLRFHKQVSNTKIYSTLSLPDYIRHVTERIHELVDPDSCRVSVNDNTAIDIEWYAACISSDTEYTDDTTDALRRKFDTIGKPWETSVILEHKDATQAYIVLTTEISLESLSKDIESASKDDGKSDTIASLVDAWIVETVDYLNSAGVCAAISSIMEKEGFLAESMDPVSKAAGDV